MTGRKRWTTKTVRAGKREAQRALASMIAEVDRGVPGTEATLAVLLERWFEVASPDWAPGTVTQTRSAIRHHLGPRLGAVPLKRLRAADIDSCYAAMRKLPGRKDRFMSPAAIRRVHVVLHAALAQAVKWGWIPVNPADAASPPRVIQPDLAPPPPEGVARLLADVATDDPDLYVYLRLAVSTGARRSQLCGLQWRDVDLSSGALTFARAVVDGPDGIVVKGTKTHRTYRVTVDGSTLAVLQAHHERMKERAEFCGVALRRDGYVFSHAPDAAAPWRPDVTSHRWRRARDRVGLEGVRLHDLRHFMATTMLTAGVPVSVAGRLGHARAATTLNVYSHFVDTGDKVAADVLQKIMEEVGAE
ncbi:MAG: tyrosine-type recombinase/integrase [Acidimicrobiales bacterium]